MEFIVTRTSKIYFDESEKPCEEAYKKGRDNFGIMIWMININSLEELMSFIDKYGQVVIDKDEIEIYDDYRE